MKGVQCPCQRKDRSRPSCTLHGEAGREQQCMEEPCQCAGGQRMDDDISGLERPRIQRTCTPIVQSERQRGDDAQASRNLRGGGDLDQLIHVELSELERIVVDDIGDIVQDEITRQTEGERQRCQQRNDQAGKQAGQGRLAGWNGHGSAGSGGGRRESTRAEGGAPRSLPINDCGNSPPVAYVDAPELSTLPGCWPRRQLSTQLALLMSHVVPLTPGARGVPVTGVLMLVARVIAVHAETVGLPGRVLL